MAERSLLDKLGVKAGSRISVLGVGDGALLSEMKGRGADVVTRRRRGSDLILLGVSSARALAAIGGLERYMERDAGVWIVYPKGRKDLNQIDVIQAGLDAGLVDNKVVSFSDTLTALRFVIPRARR